MDYQASRKQAYQTMLLPLLVAMFFSAMATFDSALAADDKDKDKQIVAMNSSSKLTKTLLQSLAERGEQYTPRTEHLRADGSPIYVNRLIQEDSPYLIQHAHNPVNWYPWGAEAFATAERENKPVFLSIGYATCHWCHVMEKESFENEQIASILNENFIAIKVDREQRPDVDSTYMSAVQLFAGNGGWPMSSWLLSNAKPFYGGTYYPPNDFSKVLLGITDLWQNEHAELVDQANRLSSAVEESTRLRGEATEVTSREIDNALSNLLSMHDDLQGGFSSAPKFPQEASLFLLLEEARRTGDSNLLQAAHFSLQQMTAGGIHDHIGGGFHRYSVDNEWLVPHFEKMLYNQAALSRNYLLAFELTNSQEHARTARRTLDYVMREMTSPEGGFYSATDADSEGREGVFFIWSIQELVDVLGTENAALAASIWNATDSGNFEESNILNLDGTIIEVAAQNNLSTDQLTALLDEFSVKLLAARSERIPPLRDDKIITEWNGMMITAFAKASDTLNDPRYLDTAKRAAQFIWSRNRHEDGSLWRAHFDGKSSINASQADYAFLAEAMLALYDITSEDSWLDRAIELTEAMDQRFWDSTQGGYFIGSEIVGGAALPTRPKDIYDNATPTGNSVALRVLTQLWYRSGEERFREQAEKLLSAFSPYLTDYPTGFGYFLTAASELLSGEAGARQYVARGKVKVEAKRDTDDQLSVTIDIKPGWHINAEKPLQDYLIGTRLTYQTSEGQDATLDELKYPEPKLTVLGFQRSELALYEGRVSLSAKLPAFTNNSDMILPLTLDIQACNDEVCLPPETVALNLSIATEN